MALATCLVSILPYWGGLQENSTKSRSCWKIAGYMTCRLSGPTQMACSRGERARERERETESESHTGKKREAESETKRGGEIER